MTTLEPTPSPNSAPLLRRPVPGDAARIWRLAQATPSLDDNSPYAYLLLCSDFADDSLVAVRGSELCGFTMAYRPPLEPQAVFVWQVCVAASERGNGLGQRMLRELAVRATASGVHSLIATVTPENVASRALFESFAREFRAPVSESVRFESTLFPGAHPDEIELRIGPFRSPSPVVESEHAGAS